jgi:hypothetical protein
MNDASDLLFGKDLVEELTLQHAAGVKGNLGTDEVSVATGQVVDDYRRDALGLKGAYYMGTDVSGTASHQPSHPLVPLSTTELRASALREQLPIRSASA